MDRRTFFTMAGAAVVAAAAPRNASPQTASPKARFRTGLVAYSYRQALQSKAMNYEDLINIAVDTGTDGIDMTVYWLPNTEADYLRSLAATCLPESRRDLQHRHARAARTAAARPQERSLPTCVSVVEVAQRVGRRTSASSADRDRPADARASCRIRRRDAETGAESPAATASCSASRRRGITDFAKETIDIVRRADSPYRNEPRHRQFPSAEGVRANRDVDPACGQHPYQTESRTTTARRARPRTGTGSSRCSQRMDTAGTWGSSTGGPQIRKRRYLYSCAG